MDVTRIHGQAAVGAPQATAKPAGTQAGAFDAILDEALGTISRVQKDVENAVRELSRGGDVTGALVAMEKADMTFQLMVEVRNRLLNAYDEIMRMQI